jgi:predicted O-methyltransferase YrrM
MNIDLTQAPDRDVFERLFFGLFGRSPNEADLKIVADAVQTPSDLWHYLKHAAATDEAQTNKALQTNAPLFVPPGHYYSPIVSLADLDRETIAGASQPLDIALDADAMLEHLRAITQHYQPGQFPASQADARFHLDNGFFGIGDAITLSGMISEYRPTQIIEVGSGYSSAVILDTLDKLGLETPCTFIEPYPQRLNGLLREADHGRVTIHESPVQKVPMDVFEALNSGDMVFFDTTHVSKTGSDVNHEIFEVLPRLKSGVLIHFHDMFNKFEYPLSWIFDHNRSWNEIYTLRAFLMNNDAYEILLFSDFIARVRQPESLALCHDFMINPGGALWLRKK